MSRYHINEKGNPGVCRANNNCPFGGEDRHFSSAREAHEAYQKHMAGQTVDKPVKKAPAVKISRREKLLKNYTDLLETKKDLEKEFKALERKMKDTKIKASFQEKQLEETRELYRKAKTAEEKARLKNVALQIQAKLTPLQNELKPLQAKEDTLSLKLLKTNEKIAPLEKTIYDEKLGLPNPKGRGKAPRKTAPKRLPRTRGQSPMHYEVESFAAEATSSKAIVSSMEHKPEGYVELAMSSTSEGEKAKAALEKVGYLVSRKNGDKPTLRVRPMPPLNTISESKDSDWHPETKKFVSLISETKGQRLPQFFQSSKTGEVTELEIAESFKDPEGDYTHWSLKPIDPTKDWTVEVYND